METIDLNMDDFFDVQANDIDEDVAAAGGAENVEGEGQGEELEDKVMQELRDISKGAAKKVVRKPMPKLNADRLTSDRGIQALVEIFENVDFKGPGYEEYNLNLLMKKMEHWAHRLFPKMTFDEVIARCEKLGAKNQVKTIVKKIRMDIPLLNDDVIVQHDTVDGDITNNEALWGEDRRDEEDIFARMDEEMEYISTPSQPITAPKTPKATSNAPATSSGPTMTAEQRERLEKNKRIAMEKRKARMAGNNISQMKNDSTKNIDGVTAESIAELDKEDSDVCDMSISESEPLPKRPRIGEDTVDGVEEANDDNDEKEKEKTNDENMPEKISQTDQSFIDNQLSENDNETNEKREKNDNSSNDCERNEDLNQINADKTEDNATLLRDESSSENQEVSQRVDETKSRETQTKNDRQETKNNCQEKLTLPTDTELLGAPETEIETKGADPGETDELDLLLSFTEQDSGDDNLNLQLSMTEDHTAESS